MLLLTVLTATNLVNGRGGVHTNGTLRTRSTRNGTYRLNDAKKLELWERAKDGPDAEEARHELLIQYDGLATFIGKKTSQKIKRDLPPEGLLFLSEDLIPEARIGLIKAIDTDYFDPSQGIKALDKLVKLHINQYLERVISQFTREPLPPAGYQTTRTLRKFTKIVNTARFSQGAPFSTEELEDKVAKEACKPAEEGGLGFKKKRLSNFWGYLIEKPADENIKINRAYYPHQNFSHPEDLLNIGEPDELFKLIDQEVLVEDLLSKLKKKYRGNPDDLKPFLMFSGFNEENRFYTLTEIQETLGITPYAARERKKEALDDLRNIIKDIDFEDYVYQDYRGFREI